MAASQILTDLLIFFASLAFILLSAQFAIRHASIIASNLGMARYVVGFIIVSVISILPETFVAITSAREGIASFGLATLFGSNVADLTFVIAVILFANGRPIRVESRVLKNNEFYIAALLIPIIFGLDGRYSRLDGALLLAAGIFFHVWLYWKHRAAGTPSLKKAGGKKVLRNFAFLLFGMACVLIGSHFTVQAAVGLAEHLSISPLLIGLLVVGLGTTIPELFFSLTALRRHRDSLALGDILGTVITDATAVVGVVALASPFSFHPRIVFVTGMFMVTAGLTLFYFMRTGKSISRKEGFMLAALYVLFVCVELAASRF